MPDTFPSSVLNLGSLQPADTPSLLDIRPFLARMNRGPESDSFEQIQQAIDAIQEVIRSQSPTLEYLSIDAADIATLNVGGQFSPGQMTVLNGPPNYDNIGWFGSAANAISVNIASIVAGLVTAAAPHLLKIGDNVYIEGTTVVAQTGFYVVATTPLATTFTVVGGFSGNSTGGSLTKQFQGGWLKTFAVGGTYFGDAPFQVDVDGALSITDALITLNGAGGTIVLDPNVPWMTIADADDNIWAILGIQTESSKSISSATNAAPVVVTIVGHGFDDGDTIVVVGATGNTAINGYRIVQDVTVNTFTMTEIDGTPVDGNGSYSGAATATRYFAGGLFSSLAIGTSWENYKLRAFADGSLKIQDALITLNGSGATITLDPSDGSITVEQPAGFRTQIRDGVIFMDDINTPGDGSAIRPGRYQAFKDEISTLTGSRIVDVYAYTGGSEFGPVMSFTQFRGGFGAEAESEADDTLGGIIGFGFDGVGESQYPAGVRMVATETHGTTAHGAKVVIETTPTGSNVRAVVGTFDEDGTLDVLNGYKVGGTDGIGMTKSFGISLTIGSHLNGLIGTPAAGQSNVTLVGSITLNTESHTWDGGILTV